MTEATTPEAEANPLEGFTQGRGLGDLSDEGLAARATEEYTSYGDELDSSNEADDTEQPQEAAEDAAVDTASEEQVQAAATALDELPEKLRGKSVEELAKMYVDLESHTTGKQASELGELRALTTAQDEKLRQLQDMVAGQQSAYVANDLVELVKHDPVGVYNQAITALDSGQLQDPSVVEEIIAQVEDQADEYSDEGHTDVARQLRKLGRQMQRDWDKRLVIAEQQIRQAPINEQVAAATKTAAYRGGVDAYFKLDGNDGADAQTYSAEVTNLLKGRDLGDTPEAVASTLHQALVYVRGMNPAKSAAFRAAQGELKAAVSSQSPAGSKGEKPLSEADRIRQGIFKSDPVAGLFADFGKVK